MGGGGTFMKCISAEGQGHKLSQILTSHQLKLDREFQSTVLQRKWMKTTQKGVSIGTE